jgi:hypothetical protein
MPDVFTTEYVREFISDNTKCKLREDQKYVNAHGKIILICSCSEDFKTTFSFLKSSVIFSKKENHFALYL